jgi:hypothetical protein
MEELFNFKAYVEAHQYEIQVAEFMNNLNGKWVRGPIAIESLSMPQSQICEYLSGITDNILTRLSLKRVETVPERKKA